MNVQRPKGGLAREELCSVLCARREGGMEPDDVASIRDALNVAGSNGWWFLHPGTFIAIFVARYSGAAKAADCAGAIEDLKLQRASLAGLEVGLAEGPVLAVFTDAGIAETLPIGDVVADAMKRAMHLA